MSGIIVSPVMGSDPTTTVASRIITQDLFPNIYALNTGDVIGDDIDSYPDVYTNYGLPSVLTPSIDPKYVTGPQKYEYRYTNTNGIDAIIRGTYLNVMSIVDVLNTYPPKKRECSDRKDEKKYVPLYGQSGAIPKNVPTIGIKKSGKHIELIIGSTTYSGSGSLILIFPTNQTHLDYAKIVLFRGTGETAGLYQETGGKIDSAKNKNVDQNTLFENAKKETEEESKKLFTLSKESSQIIDIVNSVSSTTYRVYVYAISLSDSDIKDLSTKYNKNGLEIDSNVDLYGDSYKETDNVALFSYKDFAETIKKNYNQGLDLKSGDFITDNRDKVKVAGRTINIVSQLTSKLIPKITNATIKQDNGFTIIQVSP